MQDDNPELTDEDVRFLRRLRERSPDRRDLLKGIAGGAVGLGMGSAATGAAMADASTSDSDGDVGTPTDRVDIFADGADVNVTQNKNYVEPQVTASAGTSYTADLSQANYFKLTLTGNVSIDFSNVDATDTNSVVLHLVQDATGGRNPSFTPTVVWDGGTAPAWSTTANAEDVVTLVHDQDGSKWLGFVGGLGMA